MSFLFPLSIVKRSTEKNCSKQCAMHFVVHHSNDDNEHNQNVHIVRGRINYA